MIISTGGGVAIDTNTYDKHANHKPGYGYEARKAVPTSIVVHSTSNPHQKLTPFASEADFLLNSPLVSAHYLVGREGQVVRFLDPRPWAAWHAGNARAEWLNQKSIGIELHHSVGDPPYLSAQLQALAALLRSLMALFTIPVRLVETHGQVAIAGPYQRKSDPSGWSHQDFLSFRSHLLQDPPPPPEKPAAILHTVIAGKAGAIAQEDRRPGALAAAYYPPGERIVCDDLTSSYWHVARGDGFIPSGQVQA